MYFNVLRTSNQPTEWTDKELWRTLEHPAIRQTIKRTALSEYILGKIYSQIAEGATSISPLNFARNIGFLVKTVPFADRKADFHFRKSMEIVKDIGANSLLARTYLDCGLLYKAKKRSEKAREYISKAIEIFEQCEAEIYLKQAKEELAALQ